MKEGVVDIAVSTEAPAPPEGLLAALVAEPIPFALLSEIRRLSLQGRDLWALLEERLPASPGLSLARLGVTLHMPVLDMEALHQLEADFSAVEYPECLRRGCLVAKARQDDGSRVLILTNPFDLALQTWLETRLKSQTGAVLQWHLTHPADLKAFFAIYESQLKAMDSALVHVNQTEAEMADGPDDFSFATISQDSSPVVRLVNSTVFDAMKAAASDIHMENGG